MLPKWPIVNALVEPRAAARGIVVIDVPAEVEGRGEPDKGEGRRRMMGQINPWDAKRI